VNATVLTTIIGLAITAIGTILFPLYLNRSKHTETVAEQDSVDSREVAKMFKEERDRLQLRLDTMQANYERQMATMEAGWRSQHDKDQAQINDLRAELQGVYRQLYQQPPRPAP
jgi:hypothetical protein